MKNNIVVFLTIFFIASMGITAQEKQHNNLSLATAYFGEFATHPGAVVTLENRLYNNDWFTLYHTVGLGSYVHPQNNVALFGQAEIGTRFTTAAGFYADVQLGAGYMHTFVQGDVYTVNTAGQVSKYMDPGAPGFMPSVSIGLGWDWSRSAAIPLKTFIRIGAFGQYPYNEYLLPHAAIQIGCNFSL